MTRNKHVIFGTGPLGIAVMRELINRNKQVCLVNRKGVVDRTLPDVEVVKGDATNASQVEEICRDAEVVYNCTGIPYPEWKYTLPLIMNGLIQGISHTNAILIHADNLYMYGPSPSGVYDEALPSNARGHKGKVRAQISEMLIEAHRKGGIKAAIGRASDFFGPGVKSSAVGEQVFLAAKMNKPAPVLGDINQPHTYIYIGDFAKGLITLGEEEAALGEVWHIPSAQIVTTREFISMIYEEVNNQAQFRVAPKFIVNLLGLFNKNFKELQEVLYMYEKPWNIDHNKFERTFGASPTPHREAIKQTLKSLQA